jgi:hypothetical protein
LARLLGDGLLAEGRRVRRLERPAAHLRRVAAERAGELDPAVAAGPEVRLVEDGERQARALAGPRGRGDGAEDARSPDEVEARPAVVDAERLGGPALVRRQHLEEGRVGVVGLVLGDGRDLDDRVVPRPPDRLAVLPAVEDDWADELGEGDRAGERGLAPALRHLERAAAVENSALLVEGVPAEDDLGLLVGQDERLGRDPPGRAGTQLHPVEDAPAERRPSERHYTARRCL